MEGNDFMTREFFASILKDGNRTTRKYLYMRETCGDLIKIVRYPRKWPEGVNPLNMGYVCAVYAR